jgi:hypothetical protein
MQASAVGEATLQLIHSLCTAINVCKELHRAARLLELAVTYLLDNVVSDSEQFYDCDDPGHQGFWLALASAQRQFIEATQQGGNAAAYDDCRAVLFGGAFQELADALLSGKCSVTPHPWCLHFVIESRRRHALTI